jgi:hypothetical protein
MAQSHTATRYPPTYATARDCDFVSTDAAALASHMNTCASTRSRFFGLQTVLELGHSLISSRLVTVVAATLLLLGLASIV